MPNAFRPYSRRVSECGSWRPSSRVLDLLDCAAMQCLSSKKMRLTHLHAATAEVLVDVSQSHTRRPLSNPVTGVAHTLTTSSQLYSFKQERVLDGIEHLLLQGYPKDLRVPDSVSESDLRTMAGEGIALPCMSMVIWSLQGFSVWMLYSVIVNTILLWASGKQVAIWSDAIAVAGVALRYFHFLNCSFSVFLLPQSLLKVIKRGGVRLDYRHTYRLWTWLARKRRDCQCSAPFKFQRILGHVLFALLSTRTICFAAWNRYDSPLALDWSLVRYSSVI